MRFLLILFSTLCLNILISQTLAYSKERSIIEIKRIDLLDGKLDSAVKMSTKALTARTKFAFFEQFNRIKKNLLLAETKNEKVEPIWKEWVTVLQSISNKNVRFLSYYEQYFHMVEIVSKFKEIQKEKEYLKNHVLYALDGINYYLQKPYAKEVLMHCATKKPYDLLQKYLAVNREPYYLNLLEKVAYYDPNAVKQYFPTNHSINNTLKTSKDSVVLKLYGIYKQFGTKSQSYGNIEFLQNQNMTLAESEKITKNPKIWFQKLQKVRAKENIIGSYTVDKELEDYSKSVIININLLHEKSDAIRFAVCNNYTAEEMYTIMVYARDDIFTSTYLGMFNRLLEKRKTSSMYVFMENLGFNKFRTFVQMAAGFNTLNVLLNTMSLTEKDKLMEKIVSKLDETGGNLSPAVEVADIYGSLKNDTLKNILKNKIKNQLVRCANANNDYGIRLYGLLYKLTGEDPIQITTPIYSFDVPALLTVESSELFPDGTNVQQHVFYDDEDGEAAFSLFLSHFGTDPNWKISKFEQYTTIESIKGKKIIMYLNSPKYEYSVNEVNKIFETKNRYPDLVVHRGHSYYLDATINLLTNNTKVAILGSCGGYHNIASVLENAGDAQIVSSKQIGTWTVNNILIKDICDQMRLGNGGIDWQKLWKSLDVKLKTNDKWSDYVPPFQNLGMKFIKSFETI